MTASMYFMFVTVLAPVIASYILGIINLVCLADGNKEQWKGLLIASCVTTGVSMAIIGFYGFLFVLLLETLPWYLPLAWAVVLAMGCVAINVINYRMKQNCPDSRTMTDEMRAERKNNVGIGIALIAAALISVMAVTVLSYRHEKQRDNGESTTIRNWESNTWEWLDSMDVYPEKDTLASSDDVTVVRWNAVETDHLVGIILYERDGKLWMHVDYMKDDTQDTRHEEHVDIPLNDAIADWESEEETLYVRYNIDDEFIVAPDKQMGSAYYVQLLSYAWGDTYTTDLRVTDYFTGETVWDSFSGEDTSNEPVQAYTWYVSVDGQMDASTKTCMVHDTAELERMLDEWGILEGRKYLISSYDDWYFEDNVLAMKLIREDCYSCTFEPDVRILGDSVVIDYSVSDIYHSQVQEDVCYFLVTAEVSPDIMQCR